jgi:hypothetical protein
MTDTEKKKECERICGESAKRGVHSSAPEICPILRDQWFGVTRKIRQPR